MQINIFRLYVRWWGFCSIYRLFASLCVIRTVILGACYLRDHDQEVGVVAGENETQAVACCVMFDIPHAEEPRHQSCRS